MRKYVFYILFGIFSLCPTLASEPVYAQWYQDTQSIMGTQVRVEVYVRDQNIDAHDLMAQVMSEMHRIDHAFSPFKQDSELSRLNALASLGWVVVSDEMLDLLAKSAQISQLSSGAFDITYASVGRYYDYRQAKVPDSATIQLAVKSINYRYVVIDAEASRVRFNHKDVYVDLGGIAKGHAVDRGIQILQVAGVTQASVSAGGDSRIIGDRDGKPWTVGIKHPRKENEMSALLPLIDTAVSTSGDYERYFEKNGIRYHHILDPKTGRSAYGSWSVTILGPQAVFTDALSTAVFVLGPVKGLALINKMPGIDAIIIDPQGRLLYSDDLSGL